MLKLFSFESIGIVNSVKFLFLDLSQITFDYKNEGYYASFPSHIDFIFE